MRRPLADTLLDLVGAADEPEELAIVRVSGLEIDVPIEVSVRRIGEDLELLGDVPSWRWTTAFDDPLGRLKARMQLELFVTPTSARRARERELDHE